MLDKKLLALAAEKVAKLDDAALQDAHERSHDEGLVKSQDGLSAHHILANELTKRGFTCEQNLPPLLVATNDVTKRAYEANKESLPMDLVASLRQAFEGDATIATVMTMLGTKGYDMQVVPRMEGDERSAEQLFESWREMKNDDDMEEPEGEEMEMPEDEYEEEPNQSAVGRFLSSLAELLGVEKGYSFAVEDALINRNKRRAGSKQPHEFMASKYKTRDGRVRCMTCGGAEPKEGSMCNTQKSDGVLVFKAGKGDMVSWQSSGGRAEGKIERIVNEGTLDVPNSSFKIKAEPDNPAVLIRIYRDGKPTETLVGHKMDTLNVTKTIKQEEGKFVVYSQDGSKKLGTYDTEDEAEQRLAQIEQFKKADTFTPPQSVQDEAQRALDWLKEGHAGSGFTAVGRARAVQLANGTGVSMDTIRRMHSFLSRHSVDSQGQGYKPGEKGYPSAGRVAYAAWGGAPALSWVKGIIAREDKKAQFAKQDERRFTLGPMYVPNKEDAHGEWTDDNELQMALWDYVRSGDRRIRLQHNKDVVAGEWTEVLTWPFEIDVPMLQPDGSTQEVTYPENTVFMGIVWEPWAWQMVKDGKLRGLSIGGKAQRIEAEIPEADDMEKASCPRATKDVALNLKNREEAIKTAEYGPLNPAQPNTEFWQKKADRWEVSIAEAKKSKCGNCAAFIQTSEMLGCIKSGLEAGDNQSENAWDTIKAGDLGYCEAFDFKCASARTCNAWISGGPITDANKGEPTVSQVHIDVPIGRYPKKPKEKK